jgi:hypothetical protein
LKFEVDIGYWILDIGYWILDIGYWILDIGYFMALNLKQKNNTNQIYFADNQLTT